jgi:hypothetical protein
LNYEKVNLDRDEGDIVMELFLRTDSLEEGLRSLENIIPHLKNSLDDSYQWKWIIFGLDNAIQNYMVEAVADSVGYNILNGKIKKKWWEAFQNDTKRPKEELEGYYTLYSMIQQSNHMKKYCHSKCFSPTASQNKSIHKLHSLRNEFMHFIPRGWSLYIGNLPVITMDCIKMIEFLVFESGNIFWPDKQYESRLKDALTNINETLVMLREEYEKEIKADEVKWLDPWFSIDCRHGFERELYKELSKGHPLFGVKVKAVAQKIDCDDVLFMIENHTSLYALVHLTWSGKPEKNTQCPTTHFFKTWDDWKKRMEDDNKEMPDFNFIDM